MTFFFFFKSRNSTSVINAESIPSLESFSNDSKLSHILSVTQSINNYQFPNALSISIKLNASSLASTYSVPSNLKTLHILKASSAIFSGNFGVNLKTKVMEEVRHTINSSHMDYTFIARETDTKYSNSNNDTFIIDDNYSVINTR